MGLDAHAAKGCGGDRRRLLGDLQVRRMGGETGRVAGVCAGPPASVKVAYEAGPTGFRLARALAGRGVACTVAGPGKIERPAQAGSRQTVATSSGWCGC